jgi:hypothetical protein
MSFILEAVKKAESERGTNRLHENHSIDQQENEASRRIPWIAIAVFINAAILLLWIVMQFFSGQSSEIAENNAEPSVTLNQSSALGVSDKTESNVSTDNIGNKVDKERLKNTVTDKPLSDLSEIEVSPAIEVTVSELSAAAIQKNNSEQVVEVAKNTAAVNKATFFANKKNKTDPSKIPVELKNPTHISSNDMHEATKLEPAKVDPLPFTREISLEVNGETPAPNSDSIEIEQAELSKEIVVVRYPEALSYDELPYSLQKQIPKLTISVHVYNNDKTARKVRVNGQLLLEGEQLDNNVTIAEITPYAVIFDYSGTLFRKNLR